MATILRRRGAAIASAVTVVALSAAARRGVLFVRPPGAGFLIAAASAAVVGALLDTSSGSDRPRLAAGWLLVPVLAGPAATAVESPSVRVLGAAATAFAVPVAACYASALRDGRATSTSRSIWWVWVAATAVFAADVLFRDPYHVLVCHPSCPVNSFVIDHRPSVGVVASIVAALVSAVWLVSNLHVSRRSDRVPARHVAAVLAGTGSLWWAIDGAYRGQRAPGGGRAVAALCVWSSLVVSCVALDGSVSLRQAVGRRRVRNWVAGVTGADRGASLTDVLRGAVGDPSLAILPPACPEARPVDGRAFTVVRRGDRVLARLEHRASVAERVRAGLTPAVVMALENDLLVATAANELEELRRLRSDIVRRIDAERRKLERDLHDGAQQRLLALGLRMGALAERQGSGTPLALAADHAGAALAQLRRLAHGVIPSVLDDDGLYEALLSIVDDGGPEVHLLVEPLAGRRFAPDVERAAFLVVFNSLRDARHSASPTFEVEASTDGGLSIETSHVGWSIGHRDEDEDRVGAAGGTFSAAVSDGVVVCGASFR